MHARHQAEFAAWLATHASLVSQHLKSLQGLEIENYWLYSKLRLERWQAALKLFEKDLESSAPTHNPWPALETVAEEILLSEILTRVWSAILLSADRQRQQDDLSGLVYSVFLRHLETKIRALRMTLSAQATHTAAFDRLNQLRRRTEKWTDLLLSYLADQDLASKFAADRQRLKDFAHEHRSFNRQDAGTRTAILRQSFQTTLRTQSQRWGANPQLNRQIVEGVMVALNHTLADVVTIPQPYVQLWLEKSHLETATLIAALDRLDTVRSRPAPISATGP